jgi:unsaturated chondroitin disaccharide hydrolase
MLASRYEVDGDFIQAWNYPEWDGASIIDTLMNLSVLYWAAEELGRDRFKKLAMRHMDMAARDHIRENGSTNHIVEHYLDKKGVKQVHGGQGYSPTSCWSRGTAWAIYGSVISYYHTKKPEYLEAAKKTIAYFVEQIKKTGYLPLCDFDQPAEPVIYDSSAGLCAACGMLELSKLLPEEEGRWYAEEAVKMLRAYDEAGWLDFTDNTEGIVMNATGSYPTEEKKAANMVEVMKSVNIPIIWGDFFFIEAMHKLKGNEFFIW